MDEIKKRMAAEDDEMTALAIRISNICAKRICPECKFADEDLHCTLVNEVPEAWAGMLNEDLQ